MLDWTKLLSPRRRKDAPAKIRIFDGPRTEHERDYDRILFSAPIRRLADKTQVFPLDKDDSVHTRLTHSHEVANLARSIGMQLAFHHSVFPNEVIPQRNVPAVLAAIGLAHDLGNPPIRPSRQNVDTRLVLVRRKTIGIFQISLTIGRSDSKNPALRRPTTSKMVVEDEVYDMRR